MAAMYCTVFILPAMFAANCFLPMVGWTFCTVPGRSGPPKPSRHNQCVRCQSSMLFRQDTMRLAPLPLAVVWLRVFMSMCRHCRTKILGHVQCEAMTNLDQPPSYNRQRYHNHLTALRDYDTDVDYRVCCMYPTSQQRCKLLFQTRWLIYSLPAPHKNWTRRNQAVLNSCPSAE